METRLLLHSQSPLRADHFTTRKPFTTASSPIVAILSKKFSNKIAAVTEAVGSLKHNQEEKRVVQKTSVYHDSWFDQMAIDHLARSLRATTGQGSSGKNGYESLVEAAEMVSRNFDQNQQRKLIIDALERAFPRTITSMVKILLPQSSFSRELFAFFTMVFFSWLVGPSEVREIERDGRSEKSVVRIQKCRFLEQANCVGMCTNLCKIPSQVFIKDCLGMPVNMIPNFDDSSCEMIFGQDPPAPTEDPAFKQPCYKSCKAKQKHRMKCYS